MQQRNAPNQGQVSLLRQLGLRFLRNPESGVRRSAWSRAKTSWGSAVKPQFRGGGRSLSPRSFDPITVPAIGATVQLQWERIRWSGCWWYYESVHPQPNLSRGSWWVYCALDLHKEYTFVSISKPDGKILQEGRIDYTRGAIRGFLNSYDKGSSVSVETIENCYWIIGEIGKAE